MLDCAVVCLSFMVFSTIICGTFCCAFKLQCFSVELHHYSVTVLHPRALGVLLYEGGILLASSQFSQTRSCPGSQLGGTFVLLRLSNLK